MRAHVVDFFTIKQQLNIFAVERLLILPILQVTQEIQTSTLKNRFE